MDVLVTNFLAYLTYAIWGFKKCPYMTVHNALSVWFAFIAFMGVLSVWEGHYEMVFGNLKELSYVPYVLCFISFLFLVYPLRKLNYKNISLLNFPSLEDRRIYNILLIPLFFLILYTIVYIPSVVTALTMGDISEVYTAQRVEGDDLYKYNSVQLLAISIGRKFFNWFFGILIFYSLWNLDRLKRGKKYRLILVLMFVSAVAPYFLRTIATGGRGGFVFFSAKIIFVLLPLWAYLSGNLRKNLLKFGTVILALGLVYSISMTIARLYSGDSVETPLSSIIRYFGEPFPNLGNNLWGEVKHYLMGHRMYPELFGYSQIAENSQYDNFRLWSSICGVAVHNYKTMYGDFYLEFGPFWAMIIIATMGIMMNFYIKRKSLSFTQLPLFSYYVDICVTAPLWFNRRNTGDLLIVIQCLILSWFLSKLINKRKIIS